jgi:hypothetical protein
MRKFFIYSYLTLFFFGFNASKVVASDAQKLFQSANEAYQAGNFQLAVGQYETILRGGKLFSTELYYNLGEWLFSAQSNGSCFAELRTGSPIVAD